jgi:penicillin-binding protein 1A
MKLINPNPKKSKAKSTNRKLSDYDLPEPKKTRAAKKKSPRLWRYLIQAGLIGVSAVLAILFYFALTLPSVEGIAKVYKKPSVVVHADDGSIIATYGDVYGQYVKYEQMPEHLVNALLATEDRRFFEHGGVDPIGIMRALYVNISAGRLSEGGSTITQQLAKNAFLKPEKTITRKIREAMLAFLIESRYSKDKILELYLNRVYMGAGSYGIDAAARRYFDKSATELTLPESSLIVGLLKAPSTYSPTRAGDAAEKRAIQVVKNMVEADYITPKQAAIHINSLNSGLLYVKNSFNSYYFGDMVVAALPELIGQPEADVIISTTFSKRMQLLADNAVKSVEGEAATLKASQSAVVTMRPDGAVLALLGGKNYLKSQYNRATQAQRQPGSAFKLFVYLAGIEFGFRPEGMFDDAPVQFGSWSPQNYGGGYRGLVSMREAVAESINTVAAKVASEVGVSAIKSMTAKLGVSSFQPNDLTIALGSGQVNLLELTSAYAHLAHEGRRVEPYFIIKIANREGKVLYQREPQTEPQPEILSPDNVGMMNSMLISVVENGTGRRAKIAREVAGKTGTSQDFKDAWFVGFSADLVTGVWVGNDDNSPMDKVTGGKLPAQIWAALMSPAHEGKPFKPIMQGYAPLASEGITTESYTSGDWPGSEQQDGSASTGSNGSSGSPEEAGFWDQLFSNFEGATKDIGKDVEYKYPNQ